MKGRRQIGLAVTALFVGTAAHTSMAEDLYSFADDATLLRSMEDLTGALAHDTVPTSPCRLDILSDLRGYQLFDDRTSDEMHQALAAAIFGTDQAAGCVVQSYEVAQDQIPRFLDEQRQTGDLGHSLALSYYKLSDSVTVFATLRGADGNILGSTGRFDLPVTVAAASEGAETEALDAAATPKVEDSPVAEVAPAATPNAEVPRQRPLTDDVSSRSEDALRRELAEETRTSGVGERTFNLRRIQSGMPPSIGTVRVVDTRGQDTKLITALANGFLDTVATASGAPVQMAAIADGSERTTRITIGEQPDAGFETIDIRTADSRNAFRQLLDNQSDIVVTREPISEAVADEFTEAYGVNMRSRYGEHVVAIARGTADSLACGVRYPDDEMLMHTEDHPAAERVYLYFNPSIPHVLRDNFVDFALSDAGQELVTDHAVDLRLRLGDAGYAAWRYEATGEQEAERQDLRERFRDLIRTSQRVSTTFRFEFDSSDLVLDSRSEQDLENLVDLIKAEEIDSRRVLLFGFADSAGASGFNARLSRGRAEAVATRLRLAGIPVPPRNVHGIGEDSPVACNVLADGERDELGARKNRRVEVWIES